MRIGVIGYGGAGAAHTRYYACIDGCEVTKAYDPKPGGRERATAAGVAATDDLDAFWEDLDAVSVCSPDSTHADYIVAAVEHGLDVLVEKPLCDSVEGIRKVKEAEARTGRTIAVQHQMRFIRRNARIKQHIESGQLGTISYAEALYVHNLLERAYRYDDWRLHENATPLVYSGCHSVDLLRWFLDDEPVEVYGASNNLAFPDYPESDLNVLTYRFSSGVLGTVMVAFGAACPQDHSVKVHGNAQAIENNVVFKQGGDWVKVLDEPRIFHGKLDHWPGRSVLGNRINQFRGNVRSWAHAKAWNMLRKLTRGGEFQYGVRSYPLRLYEHFLSCVESHEDFVDAVRQQRRPLCTVDEAAKTVLACLAGVESYRSNQPVKIQSLEDALG